MSQSTPPPASPGGPGGGAARSSGGGGGGGNPLAQIRELPPPYVPLPGPGAGPTGLLNPSATLRKMRSELQRRRTLVVLLFLVIAVAIIDYGPEPPQVRLNQPARVTIETKVPFKWKTSEERSNTIFDSKPLYYRLTPTNEWVALALKDLYEAIDLYHYGMSSQQFEDAVREHGVSDHELLQPKFARCLFRHLEEQHGIDPESPSYHLKQYLEVHLLGQLYGKTDYFLTSSTKEYESKRTKASEFKIIDEKIEPEAINRKGLTPDRYPARSVSKEGWVNNWRLHEDLDPVLKRWLADGVSAAAFDDDMKESLYEYFTGYAFKRDNDSGADTPSTRPRPRHLGATLELLGFDNDPATFPKAPADPKDVPQFPEGDATTGATQPTLPSWSQANYFLKEYVKQKLGREVLYTPASPLREPGTPLADENVLVWAGTVITPNVLDLLWEHARKVKESASTLQNLIRLGRHTLAALMSLLLFIITLHYAAPSALRELKKIFNLTLVALVVLGTAKVLNYLAPSAPELLGQLVMATPIVLLGMIATIAFNETVAVVAVASIALLAGYLSGGGFTAESWHYLFPLTLGGWAGMIGVRQTRTQGKYLVAGFVGGLVQGLAALIFDLPQQNFSVDWLQGLQHWVNGMGDWMIPSLLQGLVSGMIVAAFLKLIEHAFDVLSPLGLLELNDDQHPALRRIATYANGTYAHSKAVGLLSEAAAESIKADVLLVRVGVAFHDLGKTARPDEYIENNPAAQNLHDNRDPMQSAQIIIAHVHDGVQMAKQYRLPQRVIDFIPQHHGADMVKYFYHKARRLAQERGDDPDSVSESAFRYPGPKPQSREAAIVMMADTIDAASRTLTDPTPEKLRTFTHNLMMDKLGNGQLDECGLTFHDLNLCEEAFLRVLAARYHQRIRYPGQELTEGDNLAGSTLNVQKSKLGGLPTANLMPVLIEAPRRDALPQGTPLATVTPAGGGESAVSALAGTLPTNPPAATGAGAGSGTGAGSGAGAGAGAEPASATESSNPKPGGDPSASGAIPSPRRRQP